MTTAMTDRATSQKGQIGDRKMVLLRPAAAVDRDEAIGIGMGALTDEARVVTVVHLIMVRHQLSQHSMATMMASFRHQRSIQQRRRCGSWTRMMMAN